MPAGTSYTFKDGMLSNVIRKSGADIMGSDYYVLGVKNQFLHAKHPLGWIKTLEIEVDGKMVDNSGVYFSVRDQWFAEKTLHTLHEVYWYLAETAKIYFTLPEELTEGKHYVKCTFRLSMLEDPRILDIKNQWPERVEFVDGDLEYKEGEA